MLSSPPYSPFYNPVELFFSYTKRYIRKHAPATVPELVRKLRDSTGVDMIKGWYKKSGFIIPGEAPVEQWSVHPTQTQGLTAAPCPPMRGFRGENT